jgi:hypothetical protein
MKLIVPLIAITALLTLTACGGSETGAQTTDGKSSRSSASGAPRVEAAHQEGIDAAWTKAMAGENPSHDCARVKGMIAGTKSSADSQKALQACNVEIPARFFLTRLDEVERGERTCEAFMMEVFTQLPAMTMDIGGLERIVERGGSSEKEASGDAAGLIAGVAVDGMSDRGDNDPKRLIKERIASRTAQLCPDIADSLKP